MYGGFIAAAATRAPGREPRVLLVVLGTDEEALEYHERYVRALGPLLWPWEVVLKGDR